MTASTRTQCVRFLLQRAGGGWTYEDLAFKTDEQILDLASERYIDIDQDIVDLRSAGLWPMPAWMRKRGLDIYGAEAMASIIVQSDFAKRTTYA